MGWEGVVLVNLVYWVPMVIYLVAMSLRTSERDEVGYRAPAQQTA